MNKAIIILLLFTILKVKTTSGQVDLFKSPLESNLSDYCDSFPYHNYKVYNGGRIDLNSNNYYCRIGRFNSFNKMDGLWFSFVNTKLSGISSFSDSSQSIQYISFSEYRVELIIEKLSQLNDYLIYYLKNNKLVMLVYMTQQKQTHIIHLRRLKKHKAECLIKFTVYLFNEKNEIEDY